MTNKNTIENCDNKRKITKKHNGIISFWKFMFCMMILIFHFFERNSQATTKLFQFGAIGVEFFFIVSGYLLAKKALSVKDDCSQIGKETFSFIWKKVKSFFPYILIAFIFSFGVRCFNGVIHEKSQMIRTIWNLFLVDMSGVKSQSVVGQTWYISAMLISMMILYPLIRKYKKNFIYLIAPLIVLFVGGWISHKYGDLRGPYGWTGLVYKGLLRAFFELSLGCIVYEVADKIKNLDFSKFGKFILTLIEIIGFSSVFVVVNLKDSPKNYDFVVLLILSIATIIAFSEKSLMYNFSCNKFFYYLEKLSLPIYLNHLWIIDLLDKILPNRTYTERLGLSIICTFIVSALVLKVVDYIKSSNKINGKLKNIILVQNTNEKNV